MSAAALRERLLAELIRHREEAAGHPPHTPEADAAARDAGGDLAQRILARAGALPEAPLLRAAVDRALRSVRLLTLLLLTLAALSGMAAAPAALAATTPASLPLVLLVLVGANLLTLSLWLLFQLGFGSLATGLAARLREAWQWLAMRAPRSPGEPGTAAVSARAQAEAFALLARGRIGRWLLASVVHAVWLSFSLSALAALTLLLSVRAYELSWATTLLSAEMVAQLAHGLSVVPAALGLPLDHLRADAIVSAGDRQRWSLWLLAAVAGYAVVPRAIALAICLALLQRAFAALRPDPARPGYARLRQRLMPEHRALGVVDAAPVPADAATAPPTPDARWPQGRVHAGWIDGVESKPSAPAGVEWIWLGNGDDAASRAAQVERLRGQSVQALALLVRATMSPDRGVERHLSSLCAAAQAPTYLVLTGCEALRARGAVESEQRLDDWRALGQRAQAQVLVWDPTESTAVGAAR